MGLSLGNGPRETKQGWAPLPFHARAGCNVPLGLTFHPHSFACKDVAMWVGLGLTGRSPSTFTLHAQRGEGVGMPISPQPLIPERSKSPGPVCLASWRLRCTSHSPHTRALSRYPLRSLTCRPRSVTVTARQLQAKGSLPFACHHELQR